MSSRVRTKRSTLSRHGDRGWGRCLAAEIAPGHPPDPGRLVPQEPRQEHWRGSCIRQNPEEREQRRPKAKRIRRAQPRSAMEDGFRPAWIGRNEVGTACGAGIRYDDQTKGRIQSS